MMDWEVFGGIILAVLMTAAIGGWLGAALHGWRKRRRSQR